MRALVLGGTGFFGRDLVQTLLDQGTDVTVLSRGKTGASLPNTVTHVALDRRDPKSLASLRESLPAVEWDVVYDQIGFTPADASSLLSAIKDRAGRLIFTSTASVYTGGSDIVEADFDFTNVDQSYSGEHDYQIGKRGAEHVYFRDADCPVTAVRLPIVLGALDPTRRLAFHVERVAKSEDIYFPNPSIRMSFILASDAGKFLAWLSDPRFGIDGAVNAASADPIALDRLVDIVEQTTSRSLTRAKEATKENHSPYGATSDWVMNVGKAEAHGFLFKEIEEYLPELCRGIYMSMKS